MIEPNDSLGVIVRAVLVGWTSELTGWVNVHVDWLGGRLTVVRLRSELVTRTCYHFFQPASTPSFVKNDVSNVKANVMTFLAVFCAL